MNREFRHVSLFVITLMAVIVGFAPVVQAAEGTRAGELELDFDLKRVISDRLQPESDAADLSESDIKLLKVPNQGIKPPVGVSGEDDSEELPPPPAMSAIAPSVESPVLSDSDSLDLDSSDSLDSDLPEPLQFSNVDDEDFSEQDSLSTASPQHLTQGEPRADSTSSQRLRSGQVRMPNPSELRSWENVENPEVSHSTASSQPRSSDGILNFNLDRDPISRSSSSQSLASSDVSSIPSASSLSASMRLPSEIEDLFHGGINSLVARAVGSAEGTRTAAGDKTPAYTGHVDPGNGAWNMGTFSYQHGATSPEDADERQLNRLRAQAQLLDQKAKLAGITLDLEARLNGIDLANQSPEAALSSGGYIDRLKQAYTMGLSGSEAILWARTRSYLDPDTQRWNAPGLGNTIDGITADQERRQLAIARAIEAEPQISVSDRPLEFEKADDFNARERSGASGSDRNSNQQSESDSIIDQILSLDLF
ncbi:MAG: hypothetical protein ACFE0I_19210 [Elainellaceae cyanobacterium]